MGSPRLVILLLAALLSLGLASGSTTFAAHHHDIDLLQDQGPQLNWMADLEPVLDHGSFSIIIHGGMGAGKSRLIEALNGVARGKISGIPASGCEGLTRTSKAYGELENDNGHRLWVIDTPGFGTSSDEEKELILRGIDSAFQLSIQCNVPVKRIYFMIDCDKSLADIPESIVANLHALAFVYGEETVRQIRFIISKCDLLQVGRTRDDFVAFRIRLCDLYRKAFDADLDLNRVLFISSEKRNRCRTMRHLTSDLIAAANGSGFHLNGGSFSKTLDSLRASIQELSQFIAENSSIIDTMLSSLPQQLAASISMEILGMASGLATSSLRAGKLAVDLLKTMRSAVTSTAIRVVGMSAASSGDNQDLRSIMLSRLKAEEKIKEHNQDIKTLLDMAA